MSRYINPRYAEGYAQGAAYQVAYEKETHRGVYNYTESLSLLSEAKAMLERVKQKNGI